MAPSSCASRAQSRACFSQPPASNQGKVLPLPSQLCSRSKAVRLNTVKFAKTVPSGSRSLSLFCAAASSSEKLESTNAKGPTLLHVSRKYGRDLQELPLEDGADEGRTTLEYVSLPAKQYNVMDSKAVQQIGDKTFRVSGGTQKYPLGMGHGEPIMTVEIDVGDNGVTQKVTSVEILNATGMLKRVDTALQGLTFTNTVAKGTNPESGNEQLVMTTTIEGCFEQGFLASVPMQQLNKLMFSVLGVVVPTLIDKVGADCEVWRSGGDRSKVAKKGQASKMLSEMMGSLKSGELPENVIEYKEDAKLLTEEE